MFTIKAQEVGIGTHKTARLDLTRQCVKLIRLDRFKKRSLDARALERLLQRQALCFPRGAKLGTDVHHGEFLSAGGTIRLEDCPMLLEGTWPSSSY